MGYYTRYELEVVKGDIGLIEKLRDWSYEASYAITNTGDSCEPCKWHGRQDELMAFSSLHKKALFKLSGEGKESGDIWREYYQNGKMQRCTVEIVFSDFNEKFLA